MKVLFVDDEMFQSSFYVKYLLDKGFDVSTAYSVDEALELVKINRFDIAILDIMMLSGNYFNSLETAGGFKAGLALARELRNYIRDIKLIALTNSIDPEIESWFTQDETVYYLHRQKTKPQELMRIINKLVLDKSTAPNIFIVHGHNVNLLQELEGYIENNLHFGKPIILSKMPSKGLTIIEKFEKYSKKADIVFVLMTPDDIAFGSLNPSDKSFRARQNVIFEYGYFLGLMRRESGRVLLLYKNELEIPSDISGIIYINIDNGIKNSDSEIRNELIDWL